MKHVKKYEGLRENPELKDNFKKVDKRLNFIKSKEKFIEALNTLLWSWGGGPPAEAFWAAEEFLTYYEMANDVKLVHFKDEEGENFDEVIKSIKES